MHRRLIATAITLALLASCVTTGEKFIAPKEPAASKAVIYLYRLPSHVGGWGCPKHKVSSAEFQSLPNGGFLRFEVDPGLHQVQTETSWCFYPDMAVTVRVAAGETVYVRYTLSRYPKPGFIAPRALDGSWIGFEVVDSATALRELNSI